MKFRVLTIVAAAAASLIVSVPASAASLIGVSVTTQLLSRGVDQGTVTAVVGPGEEGNFYGNQFFDYGATTFSIRSSGAFGSFNSGGSIQFLLTNLNFGTPITGVTFTSLLNGVTSSFTANSVTFSLTDQPLPAATYLSATFLTAPGAVPEPATWAMMIAGFGIAGAAMRRRIRLSNSTFENKMKATYATL